MMMMPLFWAVLATDLAVGSSTKQIGTIMSADSPQYFLAVFSDKNDQYVAGLHASSECGVGKAARAC